MEKRDDEHYVSALRFDWLTPFYDLIVGLTTREKVFKKDLIKRSKFKPNHNVLDLACGTGTMTVWIKQSEPGVKVVGVDGDDKILKIARSKASTEKLDIQFKKAMSYELPYENSSFDRVVSSLFFHHLVWTNKEKTAKEIYRILKPGSELHVADWGKSKNILMRILFFFLQIFDGFENTQDNVEGKLETLFKEAGFVDVKEDASYSTMFGTMSIYSCKKPN